MGERPAWAVGMWVDPAVRRQGAAQALLRALTGWAQARGADVVNLHVTETNAPAIALYEQLGFRATGETEPLRHTPSLREKHMTCRLDDFNWQWNQRAWTTPPFPQPPPLRATGHTASSGYCPEFVRRGRVDFPILPQLPQGHQLRRGIVVPIVGANDDILVPRILQHVRYVIGGLAGHVHAVFP